MFEAWLSDLLASYLGHFLDVKPEALRVSLWKAWSTGFVLENVSLKPGAFDYLDLPFEVRGGSVGRLVARVPWRAPRAGRASVSVELAGVEVVACPRPEADWEEGAAAERALAAKRAALAAAEAERLSALLSADNGGGGEGGSGPAAAVRAATAAPRPGGGGLASLAAAAAARLVDRLDLTVRGVHVRFEGLPDGAGGEGGAAAGLYLALARTAPPAEVAPGLRADAGPSGGGAADGEGGGDGPATDGAQADSAAPAGSGLGRLAKGLILEGLALYWTPPAGSVTAAPPSQTPPTGQNTATPDASFLPCPAADCVLRPAGATAVIEVALPRPGAASAQDDGPSIVVNARVTALDIALRPTAVAGAAAAADAAATWARRRRHAALCPAGWRGGRGGGSAPWPRLWRYAAAAALQDAGGDPWSVVRLDPTAAAAAAAGGGGAASPSAPGRPASTGSSASLAALLRRPAAAAASRRGAAVASRGGRAKTRYVALYARRLTALADRAAAEAVRAAGGSGGSDAAAAVAAASSSAAAAAAALADVAAELGDLEASLPTGVLLALRSAAEGRVGAALAAAAACRAAALEMAAAAASPSSAAAPTRSLVPRLWGASLGLPAAAARVLGYVPSASDLRRAGASNGGPGSRQGSDEAEEAADAEAAGLAANAAQRAGELAEELLAELEGDAAAAAAAVAARVAGGLRGSAPPPSRGGTPAPSTPAPPPRLALTARVDAVRVDLHAPAADSPRVATLLLGGAWLAAREGADGRGTARGGVRSAQVVAWVGGAGDAATAPTPHVLLTAAPPEESEAAAPPPPPLVVLAATHAPGAPTAVRVSVRSLEAFPRAAALAALGGALAACGGPPAVRGATLGARELAAENGLPTRAARVAARAARVLGARPAAAPGSDARAVAARVPGGRLALDVDVAGLSLMCEAPGPPRPRPPPPSSAAVAGHGGGGGSAAAASAARRRPPGRASTPAQPALPGPALVLRAGTINLKTSPPPDCGARGAAAVAALFSALGAASTAATSAERARAAAVADRLAADALAAALTVDAAVTVAGLSAAVGVVGTLPGEAGPPTPGGGGGGAPGASLAAAGASPLRHAAATTQPPPPAARAWLTLLPPSPVFARVALAVGGPGRDAPGVRTSVASPRPLRLGLAPDGLAAAAAALAASLPPGDKAADERRPPPAAAAHRSPGPAAPCPSTLLASQFMAAAPALDLSVDLGGGLGVALEGGEAGGWGGGRVTADLAGPLAVRVRAGPGPGQLCVQASAPGLEVRDESAHAALPPPVWVRPSGPGTAPAGPPRIAAGLAVSALAVTVATSPGWEVFSMDAVGLRVADWEAAGPHNPGGEGGGPPFGAVGATPTAAAAAAWPGLPPAAATTPLPAAAATVEAARPGVPARLRVTHTHVKGMARATAVTAAGLVVGAGFVVRVGAAIAAADAAKAAAGGGSPPPPPPPSPPVPSTIALDLTGLALALPAAAIGSDPAAAVAGLLLLSEDGGGGGGGGGGGVGGTRRRPGRRAARLAAAAAAPPDAVRLSLDRAVVCLPPVAPPPVPGPASHPALAPGRSADGGGGGGGGAPGQSTRTAAVPDGAAAATAPPAHPAIVARIARLALRVSPSAIDPVGGPASAAAAATGWWGALGPGAGGLPAELAAALALAAGPGPNPALLSLARERPAALVVSGVRVDARGTGGGLDATCGGVSADLGPGAVATLTRAAAWAAAALGAALPPVAMSEASAPQARLPPPSPARPAAAAQPPKPHPPLSLPTARLLVASVRVRVRGAPDAGGGAVVLRLASPRLDLRGPAGGSASIGWAAASVEPSASAAGSSGAPPGQARAGTVPPPSRGVTPAVAGGGGSASSLASSAGGRAASVVPPGPAAARPLSRGGLGGPRTSATPGPSGLAAALGGGAVPGPSAGSAPDLPRLAVTRRGGWAAGPARSSASPSPAASLGDDGEGNEDNDASAYESARSSIDGEGTAPGSQDHHDITSPSWSAMRPTSPSVAAGGGGSVGGMSGEDGALSSPGPASSAAGGGGGGRRAQSPFFTSPPPEGGRDEAHAPAVEVAFLAAPPRRRKGRAAPARVGGALVVAAGSSTAAVSPRSSAPLLALSAATMRVVMSAPAWRDGARIGAECVAAAAGLPRAAAGVTAAAAAGLAAVAPRPPPPPKVVDPPVPLRATCGPLSLAVQAAGPPGLYGGRAGRAGTAPPHAGSRSPSPGPLADHDGDDDEHGDDSGDAAPSVPALAIAMPGASAHRGRDGAWTIGVPRLGAGVAVGPPARPGRRPRACHAADARAAAVAMPRRRGAARGALAAARDLVTRFKPAGAPPQAAAADESGGGWASDDDERGTSSDEDGGSLGPMPPPPSQQPQPTATATARVRVAVDAVAAWLSPDRLAIAAALVAAAASSARQVADVAGEVIVAAASAAAAAAAAAVTATAPGVSGAEEAEDGAAAAAAAAATAALMSGGGGSGGGATPPPPQPTPADAAILRPARSVRLRVSVHSVAVLLETAPGARAGAPVLEAALHGGDARVVWTSYVRAAGPLPPPPGALPSSSAGISTVRARVRAALSARAFNPGAGGWEPVLDPAWPVDVSVAGRAPASGSGRNGGGGDGGPAASSSSDDLARLRARLRSRAVMELTAPPGLPAAASVAAAAAAIAARAARGAAGANPWWVAAASLDGALDAAAAAARAAAPVVAVTNATGAPVEVWLTTAGSGGGGGGGTPTARPPPGAAPSPPRPRRARLVGPATGTTTHIPPGEAADLPLSAWADDERHGRLAGPPGTFFKAGAAGAAATRARRPTAPPLRSLATARPPPPRALAVVLLGAGGGAALPPIDLGVDAGSSHGGEDGGGPDEAEVGDAVAVAAGGLRARIGWRVGSGGVGGGRAVLLHSCLRIVNASPPGAVGPDGPRGASSRAPPPSAVLEVGLLSPLGLEPAPLAVLGPGCAAWLPAIRPEPGMLALRPAITAGPGGAHRYDWSVGVRLAPLVDAAEGAAGAPALPARGSGAALAAGDGGADDASRSGRGAPPPTSSTRAARSVAVRPALVAPPRTPDLRLNVGLAPSSSGDAGWDVLVRAPLAVENALPLPLTVSLGPGGARLSLGPGGRAELPAARDAASPDDAVLQPLGFLKSAPASLPAAGGGWSGGGRQQAHPPAVAVRCARSVMPRSVFGGAAASPSPGSASAPGRGGSAAAAATKPGGPGVALRLEREACPDTGATTLRVRAGAFAINTAGVPLAFDFEVGGLDGGGGDASAAAGAASTSAEPAGLLSLDGAPASPSPASRPDWVPDTWVPPTAADGSGAGGEAALDGLGQALAGPDLGYAFHGVLALGTAPGGCGVGAGAGGGGVSGDSTPVPPGGQAAVSAAADVVRKYPTLLDTPPAVADAVAAAAAAAAAAVAAADDGRLPARPPPLPRLRVRLRASPARAPPGRTYWSEAVPLDAAVGGAAAVVVPCALARGMGWGAAGALAHHAAVAAGPAAAQASPAPAGPDQARAGYVVALAAHPTPGGLELRVGPRFVLRSALPPGGPVLQFAQAGFDGGHHPADGGRPLAPGASRVVHWRDTGRPLALTVRPHEPGWLWSGAFDPATPGDQLVRLRHRDRVAAALADAAAAGGGGGNAAAAAAGTRLLRVDVVAVGGGCLVATLSDQSGRFAPYRLDNCTGEELVVAQVGVGVGHSSSVSSAGTGSTGGGRLPPASSADVAARRDVLRPWSSTPYAWDEPTGARRLVVALADGRRLGTFALDRVGGSFTASLGDAAAAAAAGAVAAARPGGGGGAGSSTSPDRGGARRPRRLRATVSAEGPTRVLTVVDLDVHPPPSAGPSLVGGWRGLVAGGFAAGGGGSAAAPPVDWRPWSARGPGTWWQGGGGSGGGGGGGEAAPAGPATVPPPPTLTALAPAPASSHNPRAPPPVLDVALHLAGVGLSLVGPGGGGGGGRRAGWPAATSPALVELLYARFAGLRARAAHDGARAWLEVAVGRAQVDDARPWSAHPVVLVAPVELGGLLGVHYSAVGGSVGGGEVGGGNGEGGGPTSALPALATGPPHHASGASGAPPPTSFRARLAAWTRRPDGVLCIETAEADLAPLALNVEQAFATAVAAAGAAAGAAGGAGFARLTGGFGGGGPPLPPGARLEGSVPPSGGGESVPPPAVPRGRASPARGASVAPPDVGGGRGTGEAAPPPGEEAGQPPSSALQQAPEASALKVYADAIRVGPVRAILSLHPAAPQAKAAVVAGEVRRRRAARAGGGAAASSSSSGGGSTGVQTVLALVGEVEGAHVTLAGLTLRHPLLGPAQLRQAVAAHYTRAAVPVIVKLVGSASVLGDPAQLLAHLGMGLWALAAAPAAGLAAAAAEAAPGGSPFAAAARAARAAAAGVRASAAHAVFGLSNAAAKGTATARAALDVFGLESALAGLRASGGGGGGGAGGLRGAARGAAAALAAPAAAALDVSAAAAAALRAAAVGEPPRFARVRPPRRVDGRGRPLPAYDWHEAAGLALLRELPLAAGGGGGGGGGGRGRGETYLECRRVVVVLGGEGGEAAAAPPAARASAPGGNASAPSPPPRSRPAQPSSPAVLPGRLVLITDARILVAPVRPPPPPHGMRALAAAAAGAAAAAAAAHHHHHAPRPTAPAPATAGARTRAPDWAASTGDVAGVRVVAAAPLDARLRRVEVLAFAPSPVGLSAAAAAGTPARPRSAAVGVTRPSAAAASAGLGGLAKPFRSVVLDCETEADARALAAAVQAAMTPGVVGSLGDLPSLLIPGIVAHAPAASLAIIADATAAACGRDLAADMDDAWRCCFADVFGPARAAAVARPDNGRPRWRRLYAEEEARRDASAARMRERFASADEKRRAGGVVVLDKAVVPARGRGRGRGRGGGHGIGRVRDTPALPVGARILAKLDRPGEAKRFAAGVAARAAGAGGALQPVIRMRGRDARPPPPPPPPPLAPVRSRVAALIPEDQAVVCSKL